jgi:hypothetical protein
MEAVFYSETLVLTYQTLTQCHNTEDHHRITNFSENERNTVQLQYEGKGLVGALSTILFL